MDTTIIRGNSTISEPISVKLLGMIGNRKNANRAGP
jgi:hypothetical protein